MGQTILRGYRQHLSLDVILDIMPHLSSVVESRRNTCALSGLLEEQVSLVVPALAACGFAYMNELRADGGRAL